MLVLTRKTNQGIVIGENIVVTVIDVLPGRVRLGVRAPKTVRVHRREVYDRMKSLATSGQPDDATPHE
jgi:carbon storage regulator